MLCRHRWLLLFSLCLVGTAMARLQPAPERGQTSTMIWNGHEVTVYLPLDYQADHPHPVLYVYPGVTNDGAAVQLLQRATNERQWLIIDLDSRPPLAADATPAELRARAAEELKTLQGLQTALAEQLSLAEDAVYLAGLSRGGELAALVGEDAPGIAGLVILQAGRPLRSEPTEQPSHLQGDTIYLGAGEQAASLAAVRMAAGFYKMRGAAITMETIPGQADELLVEPPARLVIWLQCRLFERNLDQAARDALQSWYTTTAQAAMAKETPLARYMALTAMQDDPRLALCGKRPNARLERAMGSLRNDPEVQDFWQSERQLLRLVRLEMEASSVADLRAVRDGWRTLASEFSQMPVAQQAPREIKRLEKRIRWVDVEPPR